MSTIIVQNPNVAKTKKRKNKKKKKAAMQPQKFSQSSSSIPVARSTTIKTSNPRIHSTPKSCRIVHRELVDPLSFPGSTGFQVGYALPLQPGSDATFSWLSNVAVNWERYRFHKLKFHYFTRSPTSTVGSVMLSPDYNAAAPAPFDEITCMSYQDAIEASVWKDFSCELKIRDLDGGRKDHFVRTGSLAANLDIKMYDCGNLFVCSDFQSIPSLGKLVVDYDVEFYNPQLLPTGDPLVGGSRATNGGAQTAAALLGVAPVNVHTDLGVVSYDGTYNNLTLANDLKQGLLTLSAAGTSFSTPIDPSVLSGLGNITRQFTPVVNSGQTTYVGGWRLSDMIKGTIVRLPQIGAATTAAVGIMDVVRTDTLI